MAKISALIISLLFSASVFAQNISFAFDNAKLSEVVSYLVKTVLKKDYIIADANLEQLVTFKLSGIAPDVLFDTVRQLMSAYGVSLVDRDGVIYVSKLDRSRGEVSSSVVAPGPVAPGLVASSSAALASSQLPVVDRSAHVVRVYFPKHRAVDYLNQAVRLAGGYVGDSGGVLSAGGITPFTAHSAGVVSLPAGSSGVAVSAYPQAAGFNAMQSASSVPSVIKDAVVFSGDEKTIVKVEALLSQLDRPMLAVQIKAAVMEVSEGADSQRSLNIVANLLKNKLGVVLDVGATSKNQIKLNLVDLSSVLSAVDGDSRFRYLSEPFLRVVDGETAKLTVGQEVPTRGAVVQDKNGFSVQSIEYRTAGLLLEVMPRIYSDVVQLRINQQISSFTTTNTSGIDSPTILKREAGSVVTVADGEVIVLAGLDEDRENSTSSGVSFLPSWLASKVRNNSKTQILIFMEVRRVGISI